MTIIRGSITSSRQGVTLVELMVVSTILVLIASLTLPVSQILRQREKENRLHEILRQIREQGIGQGTQTDGYADYVKSRIMNGLASETEQGYALATAAYLGLLYPQSPSLLENPAGQVLKIPYNSTPLYLSITIPRRFIRKIPPNPFQDWYPNATWTFKAATDSTGVSDSPWFASYSSLLPAPFRPNPWNPGANPIAATGVIDVRSKGAGISLDGTNTDVW